MKFTIYYSRSGFGLAKDARILRDALSTLGYSAEICELALGGKTRINGLTKKCFQLLRIVGVLFFYRKLQRALLGKPKDVSVYLEKIFYQKLFRHQNHILIPNQEWFSPSDFSLLGFIDIVWTKTEFAKKVFVEFKKQTYFIGFSSAAEAVSSLPKARNYFFSRIGKGQFRGAQLLVDVWRCHPEWPPLKLVIDPSRCPDNPPPNVEYINSFPREADFIHLSQSSLFHIYATETEGFGHSINEALIYGSVVLVTNAPPMNEIAQPQCAILLDAEYSGQKYFSPRFAVKEAALEAAVYEVLAMGEEEIARISQNAMARSRELQQCFLHTLEEQVKRI